MNVKKWKDQRLFDLHWNGTGRPCCAWSAAIGRSVTSSSSTSTLPAKATTPLLHEDIENNSSERQNVRYVKAGGDFIWWSERTGWGHYYLYDNTGHLKRALTSGAWRAERIVDVDSVKGILYFAGGRPRAGRESVLLAPLPRESRRHRLRAARSRATRRTTSRAVAEQEVDRRQLLAHRPRAEGGAARRDRQGRDGSRDDGRLAASRSSGWKPPETFQTKAADGVTDIYGNMWKPFDFDSTKKYPIIANVYPGPQTETVTFTFSPTAVPQQLAQLGFIVIQIGNRGGSPQRSQEYQGFSYYNLRDYALADKKAGIEQLAARHKWIDLDRVGIYGHSGGGFLTAAAMLLPPYNEFFKVGVSESGNHDNNIYNQNWSEQYHGLKVVAKAAAERRAQAGAPSATDGNGNGTAAHATRPARRARRCSTVRSPTTTRRMRSRFTFRRRSSWRRISRATCCSRRATWTTTFTRRTPSAS